MKLLTLLLACCALFTTALLVATQSARLPDIVARNASRWRPAAPAPGEIIGQARVVDGDSLVVAGAAVRIFGIDAPEWRQYCRGSDGLSYPCGRVAFRALMHRLRLAPVRCVPRTHDKFDRVIATCYQGKDDIARWMVREGLALDWPRYSGGVYGDAEGAARDTARGLWRGRFVRPWDWRHRRKWSAVTSRL